MPHRDDGPSPPEGPEVEILLQDLKADVAAREEARPYRLSVKQLGIAGCVAIAAGAAFAFWTRPVPPPPPDKPLVSTSPRAAARPAAPVATVDDQAKTGSRRVFAMRLGGPASSRSTDSPRVKPPSAPSLAVASHQSASTPLISSAPLERPARPPEPRTSFSDEDRDDGPSFDCRIARSASERMVCADADLALADRVLEQSYEMALSAGVPAEMLRAEQDDWRVIRDSAARYSRDAVADVYAQRIGELRAMADERIE
jgi:uncharacterized protein YecT (DUF1311 family)